MGRHGSALQKSREYRQEDPEFKVKLTCLVSSGLVRAISQSSDSTNPAYSLNSGETETGGSLAK